MFYFIPIMVVVALVSTSAVGQQIDEKTRQDMIYNSTKSCLEGTPKSNIKLQQYCGCTSGAFAFFFTSKDWNIAASDNDKDKKQLAPKIDAVTNACNVLMK